MEKVRITPAISTLLPNQQFKCEFKNCKALFSTISNLNMHVLRSHQSKKLEKKKDPNKYLFHCPVDGCKFHAEEEPPKAFSNLKYLKNHYQNIHLARNIKCNKCEKDFITEGRLKAHLKICGVTFKCFICDIPYNSNIALYIHNKRKHPDTLKKDRKRGKKSVREEISRSTPAQHFIILDFKHPSKDQETQTEGEETPSTETQTDINSTSSILEDLLYSNTYTQTGPPGSDFLHMQTQTEDLSSSISSQTLSTNLLNSVDAFTTDIQTQTNWFNLQQDINDFDFSGGSNNIQTQTNWCGSPCSNSFNPIQNIDELLVSTETQTSFTQCLLDSCTGTGTDGENDFFGQGFTTVETQTDSFLDELLRNDGDDDDLSRL